jgi:hypothetical protein
MKAAIDVALGYKKEGAGEQGEKKSAAAKPAEKKPAAAGAGEETDTHHANGKPKANEKGEALDADGKVVPKQAPKPKTAAELDLKPDEKKLLGPKAQARFGELITTVKTYEATVAKQTETIKGLSEARDAILGVMEETGTTPDQLTTYLHLNALLHSSEPKDLEQALSFIEKRRVELYTALGREPEGGGLDLLNGPDVADLKKKVEDEELSRADALEIAAARREKQARTAAAQRERQQAEMKTSTAEQAKQEENAALADIDKWTLQVSKTDLDYKAKEAKLLEQLEGVMKDYPPKFWASTLKRLYAGIVIQKAPATTGGHRPLRPSGAKPGDKKPDSMLAAINQGLGYANAEKG